MSLVYVMLPSTHGLSLVHHWHECIAWTVHCLIDGLLETSKQDLNTCHWSMTICDITPVPTNHLNTSCLHCQNEIDVIGLCDAAIYKWLFIGTSLVQIPTDSSKLIDAVVQWCIAWSVHCLIHWLLDTNKQGLNTCHWSMTICDISPVHTNHLNTSCLQCQNEIDVIGHICSLLDGWLAWNL